MSVSMSVEQLRNASEEELIREHDRLATHTVIGTKHYLDELWRRRVETLSEELRNGGDRTERLTRIILWLTVANVVLVGFTTALYVVR